MNKELLPSTTLSHYRIVSKIGEGGMGEVYLAEDSRLHRKVALKILPVEMIANQDRMRRFNQEAMAAAALNHPNIAHIYEIGESDGTNFIAMEFVDGVTLREKIHREKTELRKLLRYLQHVAEGLSKAHAAGIVHRDLKPDNIMITNDGHTKILDFGLAKLVEPSAPDLEQSGNDEAPTAVMQQPAFPAGQPGWGGQHSIPGMIMGTLGYMSPEQARAKPVDQRSDIFSFGCILYEAATGRKPFAGDSVVDTLHQTIHDPAPAITDFNPAASPELQRIIRKCLAKDPEKRYQTVRDTANDLEELLEEMKDVSDIERSVAPSSSASTSSSPGVTDVMSVQMTAPATQPAASSAEYLVSGVKQHKFAAAIGVLVLIVGVAVGLGLYLRSGKAAVGIESIAVMPFVNESGNADLEYLSDGMTETLISGLTQLPNLNVKARSSVFRYKGKEKDTKTIGKELSVQAILNGRVSQRGDQLTLSLELVDVATENAIWSQQYSRKQSDLVSLQSEIARDVSSKLKSKLSGEEVAKVEKTYTVNPEAYQFYLKGRFLWNKRTEESLKQAVEFFDQAIAKDPNYALAYSGLAESYVLFPNYSVTTPLDCMPKAKAAALKAIELDDSLAEAHTALGIYLSAFSWNQSAAEKEFRRAIELNPTYPTAHQQFSNYCLLSMGRFDEALAEARRAEELDPLSPVISADVAWPLYFAKRYEEAITQLKKSLILDPNFNVTRRYLGTIYHTREMYNEAVAEYRKAPGLNADPYLRAMLARSLAKAGKRAEAIKILAEIESESADRYIPSNAIALAFAALGEKDKAFVWLEKDVAERASRAAQYAANPIWDDLRDDPRFAALIRKVEQLKLD